MSLSFFARKAPVVLGVGIALGALSACTRQAQPPTPIPLKARERIIAHKQFRLASFDFGRHGPGNGQTQSAGGLEQALPAMLLTELRETGRFSVFEGGNIRGTGSEAISEKNAGEFVDGYLSGTITSETKDQVCFDVRLSNAQNHEVLFARVTCTQYSALDKTMQPNRDGLKRLAGDIARAIKNVAYGAVISTDNRLVFVDKGKAADVMRGMVAYIVGSGDSVTDKNAHALVRDFSGASPSGFVTAETPVVVGEIYIVSVEENYSVGVLYKGDYALPRDTVFFK